MKRRYIIHLEPLFEGNMIMLHGSTRSERAILNMFDYHSVHKASGEQWRQAAKQAGRCGLLACI